MQLNVWSSTKQVDRHNKIWDMQRDKASELANKNSFQKYELSCRCWDCKIEDLLANLQVFFISYLLWLHNGRNDSYKRQSQL